MVVPQWRTLLQLLASLTSQLWQYYVGTESPCSQIGAVLLDEWRVNCSTTRRCYSSTFHTLPSRISINSLFHTQQTSITAI